MLHQQRANPTRYKTTTSVQETDTSNGTYRQITSEGNEMTADLLDSILVQQKDAIIRRINLLRELPPEKLMGAVGEIQAQIEILLPLWAFAEYRYKVPELLKRLEETISMIEETV